jgi:hypothetical protein
MKPQICFSLHFSIVFILEYVSNTVVAFNDIYVSCHINMFVLYVELASKQSICFEPNFMSRRRPHCIVTVHLQCKPSSFGYWPRRMFMVVHRFGRHCSCHLVTVMKFRIAFWDVLPCKRIFDRRFRGTCCLQHQG